MVERSVCFDVKRASVYSFTVSVLQDATGLFRLVGVFPIQATPLLLTLGFQFDSVYKKRKERKKRETKTIMIFAEFVRIFSLTL